MAAFLRASAVLHAEIALSTHVEPGLKAILKGYRGHIEVIAQALKAEILFLFHEPNVSGCLGKCKGEIAIDLVAIIP